MTKRLGVPVARVFPRAGVVRLTGSSNRKLGLDDVHDAVGESG